MSTTDREAPVATAWLVDGERLDRVTFHERYAAMPEEVRAELIGGVVSMASPLGLRHSQSDSRASFWLNCYAAHTPGVEVLPNASVFLEDYGELQPDLVLRILPESGGRTLNEGAFYANGPELVVEISDSTLRKDLGLKLRDYERAGVPEYIVFGTDPPIVRRHALRSGKLVEVGPHADGIYRSDVFPGLWLDPNVMIHRDLPAIRAMVDRGVATPQHAAFVAKLAGARGGREG